MLRKLLKYDFRAVIKPWLIGLVVMLALSFVGAFGVLIMISDRTFDDLVMLFGTLSIAGAAFAIAAFFLMTEIILAIRFYKNFFTDEGYLTFTLPVKLHTHINSKLIMSMVMMTLTAIAAIVGVMIVVFLSGLVKFSDIRLVWDAMPDKGWIILYLVEVLILLSLSTLFGILFLSCCITFGSVIVKKGKALAAFGVYYGANSIFSTVTSIAYVFGLPTLAMWVVRPEFVAKINGGVALLLFGAICFMALLSSLLYVLQYRLLDRKLNLP